MCIYIYMIISIMNMLFNVHLVCVRVRMVCDVPGLYSCARGDGLLLLSIHDISAQHYGWLGDAPCAHASRSAMRRAVLMSVSRRVGWRSWLAGWCVVRCWA